MVVLAAVVGLLAQLPPPAAHAAGTVELDQGEASACADQQDLDRDCSEGSGLDFSANVTVGGSSASLLLDTTDSPNGITIRVDGTVSAADSTNSGAENNAHDAQVSVERRFTVAPGAPVPYSFSAQRTLQGGSENEGGFLSATLDDGITPTFFHDRQTQGTETISDSGMLAAGEQYHFIVGANCGGALTSQCTATIQNVKLEVGQPPPCIQVGFACVQGSLTETAPGSGIFETTTKAWVGGFEIVPRPGGKLVVNTNSPGLSPGGAGADVVFAGFNVPIPLGAIPVNTQNATFEIGTPGTLSKVLDVPVESQVKLSWTDCATGGQACTSATYEQEIKLEELSLGVGQLTAPQGGAQAEGKLKAKLENGAGFVLTEGELSINEINITPRALRVPRTLQLKNLLLKFETKADSAGVMRPFWTGRAGIGLPLARGELDVTGTAFIFDGSPAGGGFEVDGINKQVLGPLFLQRAGGDLLFAPDYGMDLRIGATVGPQVRGAKLITLDGTLQGGSLVSDCGAGPDPAKLQAKAKLPAIEQIADVDITQRACIFPGTGTAAAAIEGTLEGEIDFLGGALGYKGTQTGFVSTLGASYEGTALVSLPALPDLDGTAILSTVGIAACTDLAFFEGGFGYRYGTSAPQPFSGCDLGLFRVPRPASAPALPTRAVPRAGGTIEVPNGLPHAAFAAEGKTGAPLVRASGPGFKVQSPADGSALRTKKVVIVPVAAESKTYVIVNDPNAGKWKIDSLEQSNPLTEVRFAEGLPESRIKAKVAKPKKKGKGKGGKKPKKGELQLTYKLRRIPGQKVTFTERGAGIATKLATTKKPRGAITFKPTASDARARTIEAEVVQNGLPREVLTVARFKAPAPPAP